MLMNVIFAYFSVCSFVHVQKNVWVCPKDGGAKKCLVSFSI